MFPLQHLRSGVSILCLVFFCLFVGAVPQSYGASDPPTQTYEVNDPLTSAYSVSGPPSYATAPPTYGSQSTHHVDTSAGYGPAPTSTSSSCTSTKTSLHTSSGSVSTTFATSTPAATSSPGPSPTGGDRLDGPNTLSPTSDPDSPSKSGLGLKKGEIIGIAVTAAGVVVAIIFGLIALYYQRRAARTGQLNPITNNLPAIAVRGFFSDRAPLLGRE